MSPPSRYQPSRRSAPGGLLLACACALLLQPAGCADAKKPKAAAPPVDAQEAQWQAGIGRTPTPRTLLAYARMLTAQGKAGPAEQVYGRIIQQEPACLPAYVDLADLLMRYRGPAAAAQVLRKGLAVAPNDPVLQNNLGMACLAQGRYADALAAFEQALARDGGNARYVANRAAALCMLGRYEEALAAWRRVLPADEARYNLVLLWRGRPDAGQTSREAQAEVFTSPAARIQANAPASVKTPPAAQQK